MIYSQRHVERLRSFLQFNTEQDSQPLLARATRSKRVPQSEATAEPTAQETQEALIAARYAPLRAQPNSSKPLSTRPMLIPRGSSSQPNHALVAARYAELRSCCGSEHSPQRLDPVDVADYYDQLQNHRRALRVTNDVSTSSEQRRTTAKDHQRKASGSSSESSASSSSSSSWISTDSSASDAGPNSHTSGLRHQSRAHAKSKQSITSKKQKQTMLGKDRSKSFDRMRAAAAPQNSVVSNGFERSVPQVAIARSLPAASTVKHRPSDEIGEPTDSRSNATREVFEVFVRTSHLDTGNTVPRLDRTSVESSGEAQPVSWSNPTSVRHDSGYTFTSRQSTPRLNQNPDKTVYVAYRPPTNSSSDTRARPSLSHSPGKQYNIPRKPLPRKSVPNRSTDQASAESATPRRQPVRPSRPKDDELFLSTLPTRTQHDDDLPASLRVGNGNVRGTRPRGIESALSNGKITKDVSDRETQRRPRSDQVEQQGVSRPLDEARLRQIRNCGYDGSSDESSSASLRSTEMTDRRGYAQAQRQRMVGPAERREIQSKARLSDSEGRTRPTKSSRRVANRSSTHESSAGSQPNPYRHSRNPDSLPWNPSESRRLRNARLSGTDDQIILCSSSRI